MEPVSLYISDPHPESKSTNIESNDEINSIIQYTSMEETENPNETISDFISDNKDDEKNKTNIIAIVFASIGVVAILGVILGFIIY